MLLRSVIILLLFCCPLQLQSKGAFAMEQAPAAIVIAAFGTSHASSLDALLAIVRDVEAAYPQTPVRLAFTSNIIRNRWQQRAADQQYRSQHPAIPESLYRIKNVLGALAELQDQGYKSIVVQPTLLTHGEEYRDLQSYIDGLLSIKTVKRRWQPFDKIALGRPLLGSPESSFPQHDDLRILAEALRDDVRQARSEQAALVYMGHGNQHLSNRIYVELQQVMTATYPDLKTLIGLVEGRPAATEVLAELEKAAQRKVLLKPLMVVAGDHAKNDMAGAGEDSWQNRLATAGIETAAVLEGLGDSSAVRRIFLAHLRDAATEAGIDLR